MSLMRTEHRESEGLIMTGPLRASPAIEQTQGPEGNEGKDESDNPENRVQSRVPCPVFPSRGLT